ncbi:MAG: DUF1844 domain-containing protein [Deltaproteobacteria bacterium]|jgi:hypothetical protein|nr:DUF1844 domain-containing protein [Deltaproteobacteria bacterium]
MDSKQKCAECASSAEDTGETPCGKTQNTTDIPLPKVDFSTFLLSMASSALVQLGEVPSPDSGNKEENLQMAKHSIDIICMLQEKIKTGLTPEETRLLDGILYELRLKYVIKSQ